MYYHNPNNLQECIIKKSRSLPTQVRKSDTIQEMTQHEHSIMIIAGGLFNFFQTYQCNIMTLTLSNSELTERHCIRVKEIINF